MTTPQAHFWYLRLASFVGWFAFGYITVEQFSLLGASREARQILAYILGLGLLGIGLESIWRNPHSSSDPSSRISTWLALRLLRRTLAPVGRGSHAALLACDGRGRPSHGDQADATLGQPHPPPTRRSRPDPDPSSTPATAPPSLLAVGLERGARATMIIAAAILLSYVWNIDLIELSGRNTLPTRLLRGALSAIVIVLIADFAWHLIKAAIDRKLTQTLDPADPNSEQARRQSRLRDTSAHPPEHAAHRAHRHGRFDDAIFHGDRDRAADRRGGSDRCRDRVGAQTLVEDIISGMFYLLDDAFRIGEYIQSGSYKDRGTPSACARSNSAIIGPSTPCRSGPWAPSRT